MGQRGDQANFLDGTLDEVRVSSVVRSSNWLHTVYMNIFSNDVLACYAMQSSKVAYPGSILSVETYTITLNNGTASSFANLANGQTTTNAIPFATMSREDNGDEWDSGAIDVFFETSPQERVRVTRGTSVGQIIVIVSVVQFDTNAVRVQSGTYSIGAVNTGNNQGLSPSVVLTNSFLVHYFQSTDDSDDYDINSVRGFFNSTSQVRFERWTSGNLAVGTLVCGRIDGSDLQRAKWEHHIDGRWDRPPDGYESDEYDHRGGDE